MSRSRQLFVKKRGLREAAAAGSSSAEPNILLIGNKLCWVMQSPEECLACDVASGCAYCKAVDYDESDGGTIYQRATYICAMHKARVRANRYYWEQFHKRVQGESAAGSSIEPGS
jgi:hypothetical protein